MWEFVKARIQCAEYVPVRNSKDAFDAAYDECVKAGQMLMAATGDETSNRKDSAFGVGSHILLYPGADSYKSSAWSYVLEFEGLAMTLAGFFQNKVRLSNCPVDV